MDQFLNNAIAFFNSPGGFATIGAIVLEAAFRLFKTEKPLSIAHVIASTAHKLADFLEGLADFMDKILPQRTK